MQKTGDASSKELHRPSFFEELGSFSTSFSFLFQSIHERRNPDEKTILLICTLLFCFLWLTVLAEDNGLTGPLGEAVNQSGCWDGYRCLVPQAGNAAVMQGQGRNVLLLFTAGKLRSSFTAVYQPEDGRDGDLSLQWTDEGLILSYGEQEQFCFDTQNPTPWLKSAKLSGVECILTEADYTDPVERYTTYVHEDGYQFIEAESLFSFDIRLFPRTWEEVERFILAKELIGYWVFEAGGAAAWGFECVVFKEDGTYYGNYDFCDFRITEKPNSDTGISRIHSTDKEPCMNWSWRMKTEMLI